MEHDLKLKALSQLAHTEGDKAISALNKEIKKIEKVLEAETDYIRIDESIDLLSVFAFRAYEKVLEITSKFLDRIDLIKFTYSDLDETTESLIKKYKTNNTLTVKVLDLIERIRYFDIEPILRILLRYTLSENDDVREKSNEVIKSLTEYKLDIIYGGDNNPAYGVFVQDKIINILNDLSKSDKEKYFSTIIIICRLLLSPTVKGTSSTYKEFTWKTASIPDTDEIVLIRSRVLKLLEKEFENKNELQKIEIISAMYSVVYTPNMGAYSDKLMEIINANVLQVLNYFMELISRESLPVIQIIEHKTYWMYKNRSDDEGRKIALEIHKAIDSHPEYNIYRVLIGFDGIFVEWVPEEQDIREEIDREKEFRETKIREYAESINSENYDEWKERILKYSQIESDDLATFQYFGKFLENFSRNSPALAIKLLKDCSDKLERFLTAILVGIYQGDKENAFAIVNDWIAEGKFLFSCARLFEFNDTFDEAIIAKIFEKAKEQNEVDTLIQLVSSIFANYTEENKTIITRIFVSTVKELTNLHNSNWTNVVWFRKDRGKVLSMLRDKDVDVILSNLVLLNQIDHHSEGILSTIVDKFPEKVFEFFHQRLKHEKEEDAYDAIPYSFYELHKTLSKYPKQAVDIISNWYENNYGTFVYRGANLLKIIFPEFSEEFERELLKIVAKKNKNDIDIVLAVLRNYEGEKFLHNICKELVKVIPDDEDNYSEIASIMLTTGVVSGEYGFVEAYKRKKEEVKEWINDENNKVRVFAKKYQDSLDKMIDSEIKRAEENLILRKREYGE